MEGINRRTQTTLKVGANAEINKFNADKKWIKDWLARNR